MIHRNKCKIPKPMYPVQSVYADNESLSEDKAEEKMAGILIVDDHPHVRKPVSKALTSDGYQVAESDRKFRSV